VLAKNEKDVERPVGQSIIKRCETYALAPSDDHCINKCENFGTHIGIGVAPRPLFDKVDQRTGPGHCLQKVEQRLYRFGIGTGEQCLETLTTPASPSAQLMRTVSEFLFRRFAFLT